MVDWADVNTNPKYVASLSPSEIQQISSAPLFTNGNRNRNYNPYISAQQKAVQALIPLGYTGGTMSPNFWNNPDVQKVEKQYQSDAGAITSNLTSDPSFKQQLAENNLSVNDVLNPMSGVVHSGDPNPDAGFMSSLKGALNTPLAQGILAAGTLGSLSGLAPIAGVLGTGSGTIGGTLGGFSSALSALPSAIGAALPSATSIGNAIGGLAGDSTLGTDIGSGLSKVGSSLSNLVGPSNGETGINAGDAMANDATQNAMDSAAVDDYGTPLDQASQNLIGGDTVSGSPIQLGSDATGVANQLSGNAGSYSPGSSISGDFAKGLGSGASDSSALLKGLGAVGTTGGALSSIGSLANGTAGDVASGLADNAGSSLPSLSQLASGTGGAVANALSSGGGTGTSNGGILGTIAGLLPLVGGAGSIANTLLGGTTYPGAQTQQAIAGQQNQIQANQKATDAGYMKALNSGATNPNPRVQTNPQTNYYTYGSRPEQQFFTNTPAPTYAPSTTSPLRFATGGKIPSNPNLGGQGGMDDTVPIQASHGEFVIPADVTSALGDGNTDAGANQLHTLIKNVRKHKSSSHGGLPPMAKSPLQYMGKGAI